MRNDTAKWDAPVEGPWKIRASRITVERITLPRQTLISGVDVLSKYAPCTGWPEIAQGDSYTVSLRRDRVLRVGGPVVTEGWDAPNNHAISDMSSGYAVFAIAGPGALDLLKRGTEIDLGAPSKSAARLFAGLGVILYRHRDADCVRLHVGAARAPALMFSLEGMLDAYQQG